MKMNGVSPKLFGSPMKKPGNSKSPFMTYHKHHKGEKPKITIYH